MFRLIAGRVISHHPLNRCCTCTIFANKGGTSVVAPNKLVPACSWLEEIRTIAWLAVHARAKRWVPSALMTAVENDVPDQSAQPEVFCSPLGKVDEIYTPRTASGQPWASNEP